MKAIELIRAMVADASIAEHAQVHRWPGADYMSVERWLSNCFGDFRIKSGEVEECDYLVLWQCDSNYFYPFNANYAPDVVLERIEPELVATDDQEVWLYKID